MNASILGIGTALPTGSISQSAAAKAAAQFRTIGDEAALQKQRRLLEKLYSRSGVDQRHSVLLDSADPAKSGEMEGGEMEGGEMKGSKTNIDAESNSDRSSESKDIFQRQSFYRSTCNPDDGGPTTEQRMRAYHSAASDLSVQACRLAIESTSLTSDQIDHLVTVSCSGFAAPGFDIDLFSRLPLGSETTRTHVGFMGCHAALNGLRIASSYVQSRPGSTALVCATELCSLHHQYTDDPQQIVANSLFADGAAAMVVSSRETKPNDWKVVDQYSSLVPDSTDLMSWKIGDNGFRMTLSPKVPEQIKQYLAPSLGRWLETHRLSIESIDHWAVHPGGPRILSATSEALGLERNQLSASDDVLRECGNMSSPTTLFILERLTESDARGTCVALGFGPGLVIEAALLSRQ